jgi:hypothetical protein
MGIVEKQGDSRLVGISANTGSIRKLKANNVRKSLFTA